jgi:hypothetical protein
MQATLVPMLSSAFYLPSTAALNSSNLLIASSLPSTWPTWFYKIIAPWLSVPPKHA